MANYDIIEGMKKCDPKTSYQPEKHSSASSSSSPFCSLLVPTLLLSILQTETQDFLTEIEKADMDIECRKSNTHGIEDSHGKKLESNESTNYKSPTITEISLQLSSSEEYPSPSSKNFLPTNSQESLNSDRNSNINLPTANRISGNNYSPRDEKNELNEKNESNKIEEVVKEEKVEKLPVAELILASNASLLLHALCLCLPKVLEKKTLPTAIKSECTYLKRQLGEEMSEFSPSNDKKHDHDVYSVDDISRKNTASEFSTDLKEERGWGRGNPWNEISVVHETHKITRSCVRERLPRGNWWLPIRVLKGFLVLQGQVPCTV